MPSTARLRIASFIAHCCVLAVELMYRDLETSVMLVGASASYLMLLGRGVTKCVRTSCDNRCDNSLGGLIEQVRYRVDNIRDIVLVTFFFFAICHEDNYIAHECCAYSARIPIFTRAF